MNQYFICYDTGFFSLLMNDFSDAKLYEIEVKNFLTNNFSPFEELIDVALKIASGKHLPVFATEVFDAKRQLVWQAVKQPNSIIGNVIHIDDFENLITNITKEMLEEYLQFKGFEIQLRTNKINFICKSYRDVEPGNLAALINHSGALEIAINQGPAASLLGMKIGHKINVNFI
jgi:S-adenosylmethionine hydrolase